jgi:hypothetical protein
MSDIETEQGARDWILKLKKLATDRFRDQGRLDPLVVMIVRRDDKTGERLPEPKEMIVFVGGDIMNPAGDSKDRFALWLRRMVRRTDAIAFAHVAEVWVLENVDIRPRNRSWEDVAGRKEAISVTAQHRALGDETLAYHRRITRIAGGKAKLEEWQEGKSAKGRFAGVLSSSVEEREKEEALRQLAEAGADLTPEQRRFHIDRAIERVVADQGLAPHLAQQMAAEMAARLAEAGEPVAARPEDLASKPPANEGQKEITIVDLDEEVPKP